MIDARVYDFQNATKDIDRDGFRTGMVFGQRYYISRAT